VVYKVADARALLYRVQLLHNNKTRRCAVGKWRDVACFLAFFFGGCYCTLLGYFTWIEEREREVVWKVCACLWCTCMSQCDVRDGMRGITGA